jgi:NAD(P)H-flavin reductase
MSQPVFHDVRIAEVRTETPEHVHVALDAPAELLRAYSIPGQYVRVQAEGHKPGFFAIACGPARERLELLIKTGSPLAALIAAKRGGEHLSISAPEGKGYALSQATGQDVFAVGVGSGIAPLRALMHALLKTKSEYGRLHFIYGARKSTYFPYSSEVDSWKAQGVNVTKVCSQPDPGTWSGPTGRIQGILRDQHPKVGATSAVFICGMKPMVEDVTAAFVQLGLNRERVFQNY